MRRYETFIIIDPDLSDEERSPIFEKVKDLIQQEECLLVMLNEWGARRLAYEIKKKSRGYYVRLDYCGTGKLVDEMERFFRIDDRVMKYMTVLLDKYADIELIKEEMAKAEIKEIEPDQNKSDIKQSAPDINNAETAEDETTKTMESE
ncbi:MAG: 30S ribosomal protein S6 [Proteobacteria bacterium]|nr:30S ribosomal protein S6 [Desulfobacteraceae bacterium]MBU3980171.1 30S ribosomal protein S6 [Pseudomonadota bacterium]MBU4013285.1 30S ribosomal protein S6 [Pseudomonadota bacterium]MBU4068811.1 30S ribosomal protein S6 [Pseudomonadota bacterium]MBU4101355.1 30S ribosomal protein S6 [Pseudomonadota bacterium]